MISENWFVKNHYLLLLIWSLRSPCQLFCWYQFGLVFLQVFLAAEPAYRELALAHHQARQALKAASDAQDAPLLRRLIAEWSFPEEPALRDARTKAVQVFLAGKDSTPNYACRCSYNF